MSATPGPWHISFESTNPEWAIVMNAGGMTIANVNADSRQAANARLIAAAPELLDALEDIANAQSVYWNNPAEFESWVKRHALATIARATGEAS